MKQLLTGFTVFIISLTLATVLSAQNKDSIQGDFEALQDIYNVTDGSNWTNNSGWSGMTPETMGNAYGVTVWESGPHQGRVRDLKLRDNNLVNVQYSGGELDLDERGRYKLIPDRELKESIGNLKQMEYIELHHNKLSGDIPSSFWLLSNLKVAALAFPQNQDLKIQPTLYSGRKTPYFGSQFTGGIPSTVSNMTSLVGLYLQRNYFDQTEIPRELFELPNIEVIDIAHNGFTGELPNVELPPNINWVNVMGGSFDTFRNKVHEQTSPHYYLSGPLPPLWGTSSTLESLLLQRNNFTGSIPVEWAGMNNLFILLLDMNYNITGSFPNFLSASNIPRLNTLYLERMNLTGTIDSDFIPGENLAVFNLGHTNNISGELPDAFKSINHPNYPSSLILWGMEDQGLSGPFMDDLSGLKQPRAISVRGNNFSGPLPVDYPSSTDLRELSLNNNAFSGTIPSTMSNMTSVIWIRLQNNVLTSYEQGAISPVNLDTKGGYVSGLRELLVFGVEGNALSQSDLDQIVLDVWANVQSRLGTKYENWGKNARLKLSNQSTGAVPSYSSEVNAAITGLTSAGWEVIYDGWESDDRTVELPNTPSLLSPSDQSSNISLTPSFEWEDTGAAQYRFEIHESSSNEQFLTIDQEQTVYSIETELEENREYSWRVRSVTGTSESEWSEYRTFTTKEKVSETGGTETGERVFPASPIQFGPVNNEANSSVYPEFKWSGVEGADYYTLHMSRNSPTGMVIDVTVEDTVYTHPEKLGDNSVHHWRVRAVKDGEPGEWSSIYELQTESEGQPQMPDLVAPEHFTQNVSVTPRLEWEQTESDLFEIRIIDKVTSETVVTDELSDYYYTPDSPLSEETAYIWQVKNIKDGFEGAWSPRWEFTTGVYDYVVGSPFLLSPNKGVEYESLTPTFEWEGVDADMYVISVSRENPSNAKVLSGADSEPTIIFEEVPETHYSTEESLDPETTYYWRVKAIKNGEEGDWSDTWEFMTPNNQAVSTSTDTGEIPIQTELKQNYPNPFNPTTQINYTLSELQTVSLRVYDLTGRQVAVLVEGLKNAGSHNAMFDGSNLASGVYIYRFISDTQQFTKKMTLVK